MKEFESLTYAGEIEDVVDAELEDFMFRLFNELSENGIERDEFHEVFFLHGGWGDTRDYILEIFRECGLEW